MLGEHSLVIPSEVEESLATLTGRVNSHEFEMS